MKKHRLAALCLGFILLASMPALAGEKLPSDPRILTGELDNGVSWMYRQHDVPPGKMAIMIHVDAGSLNEAEEQRGLAHFMEHMMFNGTENFPPGELIPYFESLGMEFGADANAFTGFDQTAYMLFTPDTEMEQIDKALLVLSDYAFRALLLEEEIDQERGVILEELRAHLNVEQRLRDKLWPQLFAGSRLAERMPIGLEKVIKGADRDTFVDFYKTWYRPARVTVLLVGDAAPEPIIPMIEKHFGSYHAPVPDGRERGPELVLSREQRAIVVTDPELEACEAQMMWLRPGRGPITTVSGLRTELVEVIASWIMDRRYSERVKKGEASYFSAGAGVGRFFDEALIVSASAEGEPGDWIKILEEMIIEVSRAREHGFTERELELACTDITSDAERDVRTEKTRNAQSFLMEILDCVNDGEPVLSAQQACDLIQKLLPEIELSEVNAVFTEQFTPGAFAYVLTLPEKEGVKVPSTDDVIATARAALVRKTEPPRQEKQALALLAALPKPGLLVESSVDEDLAVTSGWLANGVRLHHRFNDYKKDTVLLSICLAGGSLEETAENAGITDVASLAFRQQATKRLSSTEITDLMTGKNISVKASSLPDAFMVTVTGSPQDLESGLQLAHALLTEGKIEDSVFNVWKQTMMQQLKYLEKVPEYRASIAMIDVLTQGDQRLMPTSLEKVGKQSLEKAQAWLEKLCSTAPIEVAVVGEMTLEEVLPLVERYIGSLPDRARNLKNADELRRIGGEKGPWSRRVAVETITPKGMVLFGFLGCDGRNVRHRRGLSIVQQTLSSRLNKRIREEAQLVYSIDAQFQPIYAFDDFSLFLTGAPCDPEKVDQVVDEAKIIFEAFAKSGPTEEELANALKQTLNNLDVQMKEPSYWWSVLQQLDQHGTSLDSQKNVEKYYESFGIEELTGIFRKYFEPERLFSVIAEPATAEVEKKESMLEPAGAGR